MNRISIFFALVMIALAALSAGTSRSPLKFGIGKKTSFVMPNGDKAFVVGIAGLKATNFIKRESDQMLTFEDPQIVDAEKSAATQLDDYWCEQLTDCNLLVWTGWAKWAIGVTNEDDFAALLLKKPEICKQEIIGWTMANRNCVIDESNCEIIAWRKTKTKLGVETLVRELDGLMKNGDRIAYMQVDWETRKGSHAVTCCGFATKKGKGIKPFSPASLSGLFIINSDNDKSKKHGGGGRLAPNTIQYQRAWYNQEKNAYFSEFPNGDIGKIRFFCFLRGYNKKLVPLLKPAKATAPLNL